MVTFRRGIQALCTAILVASMAVPRVVHAQRTDIITGRVTSDSGAAVAGAQVMVTIAPTTTSFGDTTDSNGQYRITIPNGTGEYLMYVGHVGFKPYRKRLPTQTVPGEVVVNVTLVTDVQKLAMVKVVAPRLRPPPPSTDYTLGTSGADVTFNGVEGSLPPELQGNIAAMAALVPGLATTPDGPSAFGLTSANNTTQLNGISFPGDALPRDAATRTRFISSPWDPTYGGAAGVFTQETLSPGGNVSYRSGHITLDAPQLQLSDPTGRAFGQTFTNLALSTGGSGAIVLNHYFYNYGIQASRRVSDGVSLLDANTNALAANGIARDSALSAISALQGAGVPLTGRGVPSRATNTSGSFAVRFDRFVPTAPGAVPNDWWSLDLIGAVNRSDAASLSPSTPPAFTGQHTSAIASLQGHYYTYLGAHGDYINETTSALSIVSQTGHPYLRLPGGNVTLASRLPDGTDAFGSIPFGGNAFVGSDTRSVSWELINQTGFLLGGHNSLPFKLYVQSKFDHFSESAGANQLGTFSFASLDALRAGEPSSYLRTLNAPGSSSSEWTGATALGGRWVHRNLQLDGGIRVDGNVFLKTPAANPAIQTIFGSRTDRLPNTIAVSPRLGFQWYYKASRGVSASGTRLASVNRGGPEIRGGIGRFRSTLPVSLPGDAMVATGLPGGARQLLCVGPAVPAPDWPAYAASLQNVPSECASGAPSLADTTRAVALFDPSYEPVSAWRATLGWTNTIKNTYLAIDATYSLALHTRGLFDLNFSGTPRFTLGDEGGRPVYVAESNIVPNTGAISQTDARTSDAFGAVLDNVSDLRTDVRQLTVRMIPPIPFTFAFVSLDYAYTSARTLARGFDLTTAGDPRMTEWGPSTRTPRHRFVVQIARAFSNFGLTASVTASSGLPFTPLVAGDINGDGSGFNDRAYIFDPAAADASVATGLQALMNGGSSAARKCLTSQIGRIAAPGSCTGPWTTSMIASAVLFPAIPHTDNRAHISLSLSNPLGGLDQLLHGENHLHGWGTQALPDPQLYRVTGFDGESNRFVYSVNPRFGRSDPAVTGLRSPFRATLDVSVDLGYSAQAQQLDLNIRMQPALRGTRAPADSIKARYMRQRSSNGFTDIYAVLLYQPVADSLALSSDQIMQIQREQAVLITRADSIFGDLAAYLAGLPQDYDREAALARAKKASDDVWTAIYGERPCLIKLLTPAQRNRLPKYLYQMVVEKNNHFRFRF